MENSSKYEKVKVWGKIKELKAHITHLEMKVAFNIVKAIPIGAIGAVFF
jgi:hypothetical protein